MEGGYQHQRLWHSRAEPRERLIRLVKLMEVDYQHQLSWHSKELPMAY